MAGKANKKQRHEAKRKAKRLAVRRAQSISPVKRLSDAVGETECWASGDFGSLGQMQIFAYKRAAGLTGIACFLVDRGVVGLKDSWVRVGVPREEFQKMLDAVEQGGIAMHRIALEEARRWVAGGARWAHDNGMRLPKDWLKHAAMIGGAGAWQTADVSAFAMEFAGHPEDLRQRLIGQTIESFLERGDIQFVLSEAAPYKDQRTGEYAPDPDVDAFDDEEADDEIEEPDDESFKEFEALTHRLDAAAEALVPQTQEWLVSKNETAFPELVDGWRSILSCIMVAKASRPDANPKEASELINTLLDRQVELLGPPEAVTRKRAISQALGHLNADPGILKNAVGILRPSDDAP